jgi:hypothetical protein
VAAHLDPVRVGPDHVGLVDHPDREPEDAILDLLEEIG